VSGLRELDFPAFPAQRTRAWLYRAAVRTSAQAIAAGRARRRKLEEHIVIRIIVVPLDGSRLAEQALKHARYLAKRLHATIKLVRVFEPTLESPYVSGAPPIDMRLDADLREEAAAYLDSVAERERILSEGSLITSELLDGPVVKTLAAHVSALEHPLVVMATVGRSGIGRALLGSVTEGLVRSTTVPVLAIRVSADASASVTSAFSRVLVPIAGADFGTDIGMRTADVFGAESVEYVLLHAVHPVPLVAPLDPAVPLPPPALDAEAESARTLLDALADPLRARDALVRIRVVIDVDPAHAILDAVHEASADVISMATHGYRGIKRLVLGSVAEKVLRHASVPVLLIRPDESAESRDHAEAERAALRW
jgi:nucleotide-binding universal stress UspA family protein